MNKHLLLAKLRLIPIFKVDGELVDFEVCDQFNDCIFGNGCGSGYQQDYTYGDGTGGGYGADFGIIYGDGDIYGYGDGDGDLCSLIISLDTAND